MNQRATHLPKAEKVTARCGAPWASSLFMVVWALLHPALLWSQTQTVVGQGVGADQCHSDS